VLYNARAFPFDNPERRFQPHVLRKRTTRLKGLKFRTPQFADDIYEFVMENGKVTALKERDPSGEFTFPRQ
jgi:hypothetical protein